MQICIHTYIHMQVCAYINEKGRKKTNFFCERCSRYKCMWNGRTGNSTFITELGKGHQLMLKPLYQ